MKNWRDWLLLGRISNLPTVWSNVVAGTLLAGGAIEGRVVFVLVAASLLYEGGMLLNDAFDRDVDARERPERPIPSGRIAARTVFTAGFGMIAVGWLILSQAGAGAATAGAALAACVVAYDAHHKGVKWSPWLMGTCRALLYVAAGLAATTAPDPRLPVAALTLAAYVAGLSFAAKQENLAAFRGSWPLLLVALPLPCMVAWITASAVPFLLGFVAWTGWMLGFLLIAEYRDVRRAVSGLIAGIALVDAVFAAEAGSLGGALAATAGFALTHLWQRRVPGT